MSQGYYIYIMSNVGGMLTTGVTHDLNERIHSQKARSVEGLSVKSDIDKLLFFYEFENSQDAEFAEKKIKCWTKARKLALIADFNPTGCDLSDGWKVQMNDPQTEYIRLPKGGKLN